MSTPFQPTTEPPGSAEKVLLLLERENQNARDGAQRSLFVDGDVAFWDNGTKAAPAWLAVSVVDNPPVGRGMRRFIRPGAQRPNCPECECPASRAGRDHLKRQRYECPCCHRTFSAATMKRAA